MPLSVLLVLGIFAIFLIVRSRAPGTLSSTPADPDAEIFRALERSGADLTRPHLIEFFLYFEDEVQALSAAATLNAEGYRTSVTREPEDGHWRCLATREVVPEPARLKAMGERLTAIAEAHGGGYDGWGTEVDDAAT
ncbi:MAG: ribonuclease E inhibitor RraB [Gemmatimonadales bacterium]